MKTPKRIINAIEKQGTNICIDGYIGEMIAGHDSDRAVSLYIRIPFVSLGAVQRLAKTIKEKGLVLDGRNNNCPSTGL